MINFVKEIQNQFWCFLTHSVNKLYTVIYIIMCEYIHLFLHNLIQFNWQKPKFTCIIDIISELNHQLLQQHPYTSPELHFNYYINVISCLGYRKSSSNVKNWTMLHDTCWPITFSRFVLVCTHTTILWPLPKYTWVNLWLQNMSNLWHGGWKWYLYWQDGTPFLLSNSTQHGLFYSRATENKLTGSSSLSAFQCSCGT